MTTSDPTHGELEQVARNIVYQLGDALEVPVKLRQKTNDDLIDFVATVMALYVDKRISAAHHAGEVEGGQRELELLKAKAVDYEVPR